MMKTKITVMFLVLVSCLAHTESRVLKSTTGVVSVSAPPGTATVIETTETRGGQVVSTSRQVVTGDATVVIGGQGGSTQQSKPALQAPPRPGPQSAPGNPAPQPTQGPAPSFTPVVRSTSPVPAPVATTGDGSIVILPNGQRVVQRQSFAVGQNTGFDPQGQVIAQSAGFPSASGVFVGQVDASG